MNFPRLLIPLLLLAICPVRVARAADSIYLEGMPASDIAARRSKIAVLPNFTGLVQNVSQSVVNISSEADSEDETEESAQPPNPFTQKDPNKAFKSLGSGFIINEEGYIVTNNHVVENADRIVVRLLDDKHDYEAEVVGVDPKTDLALLKIAPPHKLIPLYLGDSDSLEVGEWVIAIGNQFQLGHSVTAGIVSAKSRRVPNRSSGPYDQFIQTDASINPGSSGGPLVNIRGQVIGINTAIFSPGRQQYGNSGFNIGIGFAIPINQAKGVIRQLKDGGKVTRGLLGVIIQRVDVDMAGLLKLKEPYGALVADVMESSPAGAAGFRRKDVIVKYNGEKVNEHDDLPLMVAETPVGKVVEVEVIRNGRSVVLTPEIQELSDAKLLPEVNEERPEPDRIGLIIKGVTEEISRSLGLKSTKGVAVLSVEPGSLASEAGISRGDIILEFLGREIDSEKQFRKLVESAKKDQPILVLVRRKEGTRFLILKITE